MQSRAAGQSTRGGGRRNEGEYSAKDRKGMIVEDKGDGRGEEYKG